MRSVIHASLTTSGVISMSNMCNSLSYNSFTLTISITIMPTFLYEAHTAWLYREVSRMARSGFLTPSEEDSISFLKSPSTYNAIPCLLSFICCPTFQ